LDINLIVSSVIILLGLIGTVLPILPGPIIVFAGIGLYGFLDHFAHFSWHFLILEAVLAGSTYVTDQLMVSWGVKRFEGSKKAAWGAMLGTLMIFVIGPWGILIGPFFGAMTAELVFGNQLKKALKSGFGSFMGLLAGMLIKFAIVGIMIGLFIIKIV